ncbi:MAG: hypothetical protein F4X44_10010 [Gammaproteobacteria bacterium]|nr:hypothetical protein [Gammaproteobacteria bacterium]
MPDQVSTLYSYVLVTDSGLAPNPYHGYCTLAVCKPKIRAKAQAGDIVIGTGSAACHVQRGDQMIYAMWVTEVLTTAQYWSDPRFNAKKPNKSSSIHLVGDNIYEPLDNCKWNQLQSLHFAHDMKRDLSEKFVLVSDKFVYFGSDSPTLPQNFVDGSECLIKRGPGHRTESREEVIAKFVDWIEELGGWSGVPGNPSNGVQDKLSVTIGC